jgi:hypothetical protein
MLKLMLIEVLKIFQVEAQTLCFLDLLSNTNGKEQKKKKKKKRRIDNRDRF